MAYISKIAIGNSTYDLKGYPTLIPCAYCNTAAATAAKTATCTDYTLTSKTYLHVLIKTANSSAGKITLNVNGKGAKDIWINGTVSSASNYTLPAGSYITYYDGSKYLFRTDGKLVTSDLIAGLGTAAVKDVPSSGDASSTQVVMGNDSRLTNSRTPTSHTHGSITNAGAITSNTALANGDRLVFADSDDNGVLKRTSISFDGSTTTQALSKKGTWESYLPSTGGTLTGNVLLSVNTYETTPATDDPAQIQLQSIYTGGGSQYTSSAFIRAYSDHAGNGANLVLHSGGNLFIGSGEAPNSHYNLYKNSGTELTYITSDNVVNIQAGAQTFANRKGLKILSDGSVIPDVADVSTDNAGSIGTSSYKWSNIYTYKLNGKKVDNYTNFVRTGTIGNLSSTVDANLRWYRVATWEITTKNTDVAAMISVSNTYTNGSTANQCAGLLYVHFRQSELGTCQHANLNFVVNKGFTTNHFKLVWMPSDDPSTTGYDGLTCCLYTYIDVRYLTRRFTILDDGYRTATASLCNIFDNTSREVEPTTTQGWTSGVYAA